MKDNKQRRQFYTIVLVALVAAAGWKWYRGVHHTAMILFALAVIPWTLEIVLPRVSQAIFRGWMFFAETLGTINTYVIVTLLFFGALVPASLFLRLTGKRGSYERDSRRRSSSWLPIEDPRPLEARYTTPY